MFHGMIYFAGKSGWARRLDKNEVIAHFSGRWRWLVIHQTRSAYRNLISSQCGYVIQKDDDVLLHIEAAAPPTEG